MESDPPSELLSWVTEKLATQVALKVWAIFITNALWLISNTNPGVFLFYFFQKRVDQNSLNTYLLISTVWTLLEGIGDGALNQAKKSLFS